METKQRTYAELKQAVLTVQAFAEERTGSQIAFFRQGLEEGLRMAGLDTDDFWEKFVNQFQIEHEQFDWSKYEWASEDFPPFPPYTLKWWIGFFATPLLMPIGIAWALLRWVIEQLFGHDTCDGFRDWIFPKWKQQRVTPPPNIFTGKDLITSYLEGRMCTRQKVRYELIRSK
jgi:hypothetical protein